MIFDTPIVYLTKKEKIIAAISIGDVIRLEIKQAIQELGTMGIEAAMLTSDSQTVERQSQINWAFNAFLLKFYLNIKIKK